MIPCEYHIFYSQRFSTCNSIIVLFALYLMCIPSYTYLILDKCCLQFAFESLSLLWLVYRNFPKHRRIRIVLFSIISAQLNVLMFTLFSTLFSSLSCCRSRSLSLSPPFFYIHKLYSPSYIAHTHKVVEFFVLRVKLPFAQSESSLVCLYLLLKTIFSLGCPVVANVWIFFADTHN